MTLTNHDNKTGPAPARQQMPSKPVKTKEPKPEKKTKVGARYKYVGYELETGTKVEGSIPAVDELDARTQLKERGVIADSVKPATAVTKFLNTDFSVSGGRIKDKDVSAVARQLAVFEGSGLSTFRAIGMIAREQPDNSKIGVVLRDVHQSIANGDEIGTAFAKHEDKLGTMTVALIDAGEKSASLHKTLGQLADMTERQVKLKRKVRTSMAYPIAIATLSILAVVGSLLFVIPTFEDVYVDFGIDLPFLTRMLLSMSDWMRANMLLLPLVPIGLFVGWKKARKSPKTGEKIDAFLLRLPLVGDILHKSIIARVADTLAVLLESGVPMMKAIDLAAAASGNKSVHSALLRSRTRFQEGVQFSDALKNEPAIPEVLPALMAQGEATSNPEALLASFAEMTQNEVDAKVVTLTELMQPLLMMFVMAMIGVLGIAIYLPILGIYDQFVGQ